MEIKRSRYRTSKNRDRTKKPLLFGIFLFIISISGYSYAAITKPLQAVAPQVNVLESTSPEQISLPWPTGQGVVGTVNDGVLAASSEAEEVKPIASMTKLITALAVLEKRPMQLNEPGVSYIVTPADVAIYRDYISRFGSVMPVRSGQTLTQYHALQGLLLPSANNIADMLAINEFGSVEAYVQYANEMISRFGLKNTTVADASGFSAQTVSTPSDMFEIGRRALEHPVIAEIVAEREAFIPVSGMIHNTNQLLADEDMLGLKTGTTDEAGSCLLFAFNHTLNDGSKEIVIGVGMGVPNWPELYRDVRILVDSTKNSFKPIEVIAEGAVIGKYETAWGDTAEITVEDTLIGHGWAGQSLTPEAVTEKVSIPAHDNMEVGSILVEETSEPLTLKGDISGPSIWWRLANYW